MTQIFADTTAIVSGETINASDVKTPIDALDTVVDQVRNGASGLSALALPNISGIVKVHNGTATAATPGTDYSTGGGGGGLAVTGLEVSGTSGTAITGLTGWRWHISGANLRYITHGDRILMDVSVHDHSAESITGGYLNTTSGRFSSLGAGEMTGGYINIASGRFSGLETHRGAADNSLIINANSGQNRQILMQSNGLSRAALLLTDAAETSGTNFGSNLSIALFDDGGNFSGFLFEAIRWNASFKVNNELEVDGTLNHDGSNLGFRGSTPIAKPTATGSRGGNAALASLLQALADQGIIADGTS